MGGIRRQTDDLDRGPGRPEKGSGSENVRVLPEGPYEFIYIDIDLCTFALIKLLKLGVSAASQSEAKHSGFARALGFRKLSS